MVCHGTVPYFSVGFSRIVCCTAASVELPPSVCKRERNLGRVSKLQRGDPSRHLGQGTLSGGEGARKIGLFFSRRITTPPPPPPPPTTPAPLSSLGTLPRLPCGSSIEAYESRIGDCEQSSKVKVGLITRITA